jgi:hypothetical protein
MDNFIKIPESLYDEILQFNEITEIIKFSTTSRFHYEIIKKNTENNSSKLQRIYNVSSPIIDLETWLFAPQHLYVKENSKHFLNVYKEYNDFLLPEFKSIFLNFTKLYKDNDDVYIFNMENYYLVKILFSITKNNINLFTKIDLKEKNVEFLKFVINKLLWIYATEFFLNLNSKFITPQIMPKKLRNDLLSILKKIMYDLINFLIEYDDLEECFVMEIIQDILFLECNECNEHNHNIKIFQDFLENVILNNNLTYYFLSSEGLSSHEEFEEDEDYNYYLDYADF